jgi:hypothetical protein
MNKTGVEDPTSVVHN